MDPFEGVRHHELGSQQADAVDRQRGHLLGVLGEGQVDVDLRRERPGPPEPACAAPSSRPARRRPRPMAPSVTVPWAPSTVTSSPSRSTVVAVRAPTTAGTPSSRETMAAWQVMPPPSVTRAAARRMVGTQSGLVIGATRTSPGCRRSPWSGDCSTRTDPRGPTRRGRQALDEQRALPVRRRGRGGTADGRDGT